MTIEAMEALDREYITVVEASEILGCKPQRLRDGLDLRPEQFGFPHCKIGNRHRIMRRGFLRWVKGEPVMEDVDPAVAEAAKR